MCNVTSPFYVLRTIANALFDCNNFDIFYTDFTFTPQNKDFCGFYNRLAIYCSCHDRSSPFAVFFGSFYI